jgi:drug/metabolite transporter (DMT)-like permease
MDFLYLFLAMSFSAAITIAGRLYNIKCAGLRGVSYLYSALTSALAASTWLVFWIFDFSFDIKVFPYAVLYGVCYVLFTFGMLGALKFGSTSLTALVKQIALVFVSVWGFVFWNTPLTLIGGIGIALIVISLSLCLLTKEKNGENHNTAKWMVFAVMISVGNAGCSIIQRYQQMAFNYNHKYMLMFFALLFASVLCVLMSLREDKTNWKRAVRVSWAFPALAGCGSALSNVFILLMVKSNLSPVILYPGVAVGGLMLTVIASLLFFREKLRPMQIAGLTVGAVALVLLNL